jgi:hypothetical protein
MWTTLESPSHLHSIGNCLWRIIIKIHFNQYIRHSIHYNTLIPTSLDIETHTLLVAARNAAHPAATSKI